MDHGHIPSSVVPTNDATPNEVGNDSYEEMIREYINGEHIIAFGLGAPYIPNIPARHRLDTPSLTSYTSAVSTETFTAGSGSNQIVS